MDTQKTPNRFTKVGAKLILACNAPNIIL